MSTKSGETIHIRDLRAPVLTGRQRFALGAAELSSVTLRPDAVLSAAMETTGLHDFGPDDFRDRLAAWLAGIDADANRTALSRVVMYEVCYRFAMTRLRLHDLLTRHPEIHDVEIREPIIVVGLPRTGTTHLLNLISADDGLRSLPLWESWEPVPVPGEPVTADERDPRHARCARQWDQQLSVLPHVAAMHPMDADHIHEETELQGPDFAGYSLEWMARVPEWRDHYLVTDQTPHYRYMRTALQALQWQRGPDRWVLKSPQHLEQLGPLLATFPDATVVVTHRDPVSVVQSAATMMTYVARLQYHKVEPGVIFDYWADRIETMLRASVRDRHLLPADRTVDVLFHEFMADDLGTVERIYKTAGRELTAGARQAMEDFAATHTRDRFGRVDYDLRRDFGVEPAALRERFGFYLDRFPVAVEVE